MSKIFTHLLVGLMLLVWPISAWPQTPAMSHSSHKCSKGRQGCGRKPRAATTKSISKDVIGVNNTARAPAAKELSVAHESGVSNIQEPAPSRTPTQEAQTASATPSAPPGQITGVELKDNASLARELADYTMRRIQDARLSGPGYDLLLEDAVKHRQNPSNIIQRLDMLIGPPGASLRACRFYLLKEKIDNRLTRENLEEFIKLLPKNNSNTKSCPRILEGIFC